MPTDQNISQHSVTTLSNQPKSISNQQPKLIPPHCLSYLCFSGAGLVCDASLVFGAGLVFGAILVFGAGLVFEGTLVFGAALIQL